nr:hypothetical protein [Tanacetum cinerariifolium]
MGKCLKPKEQGGLGIKNLQIWNEVLVVKQFWNVIAKKDTLWVKYVNTENLKIKSIWEITAKTNSSAGWKEMLKLRSKFRKHVIWKVGNGHSINACYDNWCSLAPLCDIVTSREIYEADKAVWVDKNGKENLFSAKLIWKDLNDKELK